jgi:hypothetical protein
MTLSLAMHEPLSLPLADLGDVLSGLLPIILFVLYGIAQLVGNLQQEKRKAPPRPRPAQPPQEFGPPPAAKPAVGNQPNLEETLRREVEEFLRRAQGQPQDRQGQQRPQPGPRGGRRTPQQARRQQQRTPEPELQPVRRLVETERPEPAAPLSPLSTPRSLQPASPLGSGVALHSQTIVDHAHTLGAQVAQADERMEAHLREKFVHQLGALAPATVTREQQAAAAANAAAQLRSMLSRPESVRQIIVASEILRRPEERWE